MSKDKEVQSISRSKFNEYVLLTMKPQKIVEFYESLIEAFINVKNKPNLIEKRVR